jgi:hypothetical protein
MRKYVAALPGVQWVVSCQGGEVSDASRTTMLSRQFLPAAAVEKTLEAGHALGFSTVAYMVEGVFTDSASEFEMDFYTDLAGHRPVLLDRNELLARDVFKVIWMAAGTVQGKTGRARWPCRNGSGTRSGFGALGWGAVAGCRGKPRLLSSQAVVDCHSGMPPPV